MATLAAINQLGESVVALLRARRDLLASAGQLNSLPAAFPIEHVSAARLGTTPPTAGLSLTCYHISLSEHQRAQSAARSPTESTKVALELRYLVAIWSTSPAEEQAIMAWAMLELARHAVLDRSVLLGADVWERDEVIQVLMDVTLPEQVMRVWDSLGQKYRLSFTFTARVVRIGFGPTEEWRPVVATRFGFADVDPLGKESV